jgi:hypothetical protein
VFHDAVGRGEEQRRSGDRPRVTKTKPAVSNGFREGEEVERTGLEPVTSWLQTRCSPN